MRYRAGGRIEGSPFPCQLVTSAADGSEVVVDRVENEATGVVYTSDDAGQVTIGGGVGKERKLRLPRLQQSRVGYGWRASRWDVLLVEVTIRRPH